MSCVVDGPPEGPNLRAMVTLGEKLGTSLWEQAHFETTVASLFPPQAEGRNGWGEEIRAGALVIATNAIIRYSTPVLARAGTDLHRLIEPVPAVVWDRWFDLVSRSIQCEADRFAKVRNWRIERTRWEALLRRGESTGKSPAEEVKRLTALMDGLKTPYLPENLVRGGAAFVARRGVHRFLLADEATRSRREVALITLAAALRGKAREALNKALDQVRQPA
jgi:hypothetical protein